MRALEVVDGCHYCGVGLLGVVSFVVMLKRGMFCMHSSLNAGMSSWKTI